jgi:hypothetical protein
MISASVGPFHARERTPFLFTVVFYGAGSFLCKTAQFCATRRESEMAETPSIRNGAQARENERKNSFLNYKSVALSDFIFRVPPQSHRSFRESY